MSIYEKMLERQAVREQHDREEQTRFYRFMWGVLATVAVMFCAEFALLVWLVLRKG